MVVGWCDRKSDAESTSVTIRIGWKTGRKDVTKLQSITSVNHSIGSRPASFSRFQKGANALQKTRFSGVGLSARSCLSPRA